MKNIILISLMAISLDGMAFVTLGNDVNCDFNTSDTSIQELIDDNEKEIRLTNQITFKENLSISKTIDIIGGFDSCLDAEILNFSNNKTEVDGNYLATVIKIGATDAPMAMHLEGLVIKNGKSNSSIFSGGGINILDFSTNNINVILENVYVSNNEGKKGGGIYTKGENINLTLRNSLVINNEALGASGGSANGGGIYCEQSQVNIREGSGVSANSAYGSVPNSGNGGGIFASNACLVNINHGVQSNNLFSYQGMSQNSSSAHGGAIYAESGAVILVDGLGMSPVNLNDNYADADFDGYGDGGAVYAKDNSTTVSVSGSIVSNNHAINGGAFAIMERARLGVMDKMSSCWNRKKCNVIKDNLASKNNGKGGAFYGNQGDISVSRSYVSGNRADHGTVLFIENESVAAVSTAFIFDNGGYGNDGWADVFTYRSVTESTLVLSQITSVKNQSVNATIGQNTGTNIINNSIFFEPDTNQLGNFIDTTDNQKCLVMDNEYGMSNHTDFILGVPHFVDASQFDLHLQADSLGIDMCSGAGDDDIDGEPGIWDDPNVINMLGSIDAGADESYAGDVIFKNNFKAELM